MDHRRRQESFIDDRPNIPNRQSPIIVVRSPGGRRGRGRRQRGGQQDHNKDTELMFPPPFTNLYPTRSNFERHGIAIGNIVEEETPTHAKNRAGKDPTDCGLAVSLLPDVIKVPIRQSSKCFSEVTTPRSIIETSTNISHYHDQEPVVDNNDNYLDDEELEIYLQQMEREEEWKKHQRESLKKSICSSNRKEYFQKILSNMKLQDSSDDFTLIAAGHSEKYLQQLIEEQIQVEQQYEDHERGDHYY